MNLPRKIKCRLNRIITDPGKFCAYSPYKVQAGIEIYYTKCVFKQTIRHIVEQRILLNPNNWRNEEVDYENLGVDLITNLKRKFSPNAKCMYVCFVFKKKK